VEKCAIKPPCTLDQVTFIAFLFDLLKFLKALFFALRSTFIAAIFAMDTVKDGASTVVIGTIKDGAGIVGKFEMLLFVCEKLVFGIAIKAKHAITTTDCVVFIL